MSNNRNKFYVFISFFSLGLCCVCAVWFYFVMSVVRQNDIKKYKVDNALIISNLHLATHNFLSNYLSNQIPLQANSSASEAPSSPSFSYPAISFENFGYALYSGQDVAIYPNNIYYYVGDFHPKGLIQRITDRAIYCLTESNTIHIVRLSRPSFSPPASELAPASSDAGGEKEDE